jgi:hypothetical protein
MLCGLQRPIKNYDPSTYENELYLITKKSKGYGQGFDDEFEPILGDEVYTPIISNRILDIVKVFREKGIIRDYEHGEISSKKDEENSFLENMVESMLINIFTGKGDNSDNNIMKAKVKDLTDQVAKLKTDYNKLDDEHNILIHNNLDKTIDYNKSILLKDLLNYTLIHFLKYCNAEIWGIDLHDFKVFLKTIDSDSTILIGCLYQDLTVEEWCSLMDKIQGTLQVQVFLDYFTSLKRAETKREYNKFQLLNNLMMFRVLKLSS